MSPCSTPRFIGNDSENTSVPSVLATLVTADAVEYTARNSDLLLSDAPASLSALSKNM